jgi:hypothetical protein
MIPVNATIISVMLPPKTTAVTVPINLAVTPLSKHPIHLKNLQTSSLQLKPCRMIWSLSCRIV